MKNNKRQYKRKCEVCGESKLDVRRRECGYTKEIDGKIVKELICDNCERQHLDDI